MRSPTRTGAATPVSVLNDSRLTVGAGTGSPGSDGTLDE